MGYRSIIISSPAKLSVKNEQLMIEGEVCGKVPIEDIRTLMIESRSALITSYTMTVLAQAGVCVYFCDEKHLPCAVVQPFSQYSRQRKRIMSQLGQSKPRLKRLWQNIVTEKTKNQAKCLELCGVDSLYYEKLVKIYSPEIRLTSRDKLRHCIFDICLEISLPEVKNRISTPL